MSDIIVFPTPVDKQVGNIPEDKTGIGVLDSPFAKCKSCGGKWWESKTGVLKCAACGGKYDETASED